MCFCANSILIMKNFKPDTTSNGHWYSPEGQPFHFVPRKTGSGNRPTTLADAKELGLLPSVTNIIKMLRAPALERWLIQQAVWAVSTAPDVPGEDIGAKIERVLVAERQQDEEAERARDLGSRIHEAIESSVKGETVDMLIQPYVTPALLRLKEMGEVIASEVIVVGEGYAGKIDLVLKTAEGIEVWDVKTTRKLPKASWPEARLQTAAYAAAWHNASVVATGNLYVSTDLAHQGEFVECRQEDWLETFEKGFEPLLKCWCWLNAFTPPKV